MKKGIDVSYINGAIDWEKVKPQIDFAMIRAGYGANHVDKAFSINASACEELGIPIGLYWFSYACTAEMAEQEAESCLSQAGRFGIDYPVAFDFGYDSIRCAQERGYTVTKELVMELALLFCSKVRRLGYQAAVSVNEEFSRRYFDLSEIEKRGYDIWYCHCAEAAGINGIALWQYSTSGHIDGIGGRVNLDYALKDFPCA